MEAGRYAAPIHGYGYTVMVRRGTTSFGMAQFGEVWLGGHGEARFGRLRFGLARRFRSGWVR